MPLYEYICRDCGKRVEVLQRMGADAKGLTCPSCGGSGLEKQCSAFAAGGSRPAAPRSSAGCGTGGFR